MTDLGGAGTSSQTISVGPEELRPAGPEHVVITAAKVTSSMPMMIAQHAFPGSALWFLGKPTTAGMHAGTLTFTAGSPGTYRYLCPVPGHAQKGMTGTFAVN